VAESANGTLPKELARLPRHSGINVNFNELEGQVPSAFFDATSPYVSVWYNDLKCSNWEVLQEVNIVGVPSASELGPPPPRPPFAMCHVTCHLRHLAWSQSSRVTRGVPLHAACGARAVDMNRMDAGNVQLNCQGQEENGMRTIINSEGVSDTTAFLCGRTCDPITQLLQACTPWSALAV